MILLTTINDIRKYRQLGKQLNSDNFEGRVREVQENELTELLGRGLAYDFFNSLENSWTNVAQSFERVSDTVFKILTVDLSATILVGYAIRINSDTFVIVKTSTFDATDTIIEVEGYILPDTLTTIDYKVDNKYIKLLNGYTYTKDSEIINFNGLRPFIAWKLLAIFVADGNLKHSDTGNFSITSPNFDRPTSAEINAAKATYLQNSTREENNIIDYLNENSSTYPLWNLKRNENIENFNFIVI
jgi:hypothetical protein